MWLFSWTAAIVLVVSFVALSTLWTTPAAAGAAPPRGSCDCPAALEWLASLVGVGLFVLVVYSGFAGAQVPLANFSVTFIYVIFWVGLPLASVLFGDVFRALSPWRTCARVLGRDGRVAPARSARPSPAAALSRVAGDVAGGGEIVGFAWLELIYVPERDHPRRWRRSRSAYFVVMLAGMVLFGVEQWGGQADGFGAYFGLLSRLSALVP